MPEITKSSYADSIGVAPAYITKELINNPGCIDLVNCGTKNKVNPDGPNSREFFTAHYNPEKVRPPKPPKIKKPRKRQAPKKPPKPKAKTEPKKQKQKILPADDELLKKEWKKAEEELKSKPKKPEPPPKPIEPPKAYTDKQELEKQKLVSQIRALDVATDKKRGILIPVILIKRVFGRLHSIDENQFKTLGVSASPEISAIYNNANETKTKQILELFGKEKDKNLKKSISKILNAKEAERILEMTGVLENKASEILKAIKREIDKFLKNIERLKE